jgi:hypothetical protein
MFPRVCLMVEAVSKSTDSWSRIRLARIIRSFSNPRLLYRHLTSHRRLGLGSVDEVYDKV